jgi:hypothetical protein
LDLSDQGQRVYNEITPIALRYEKSLVNGLSASERERLDELLTKLQVRAASLLDTEDD